MCAIFEAISNDNLLDYSMFFPSLYRYLMSLSIFLVVWKHKVWHFWKWKECVYETRKINWKFFDSCYWQMKDEKTRNCKKFENTLSNICSLSKINIALIFLWVNLFQNKRKSKQGGNSPKELKKAMRELFQRN